MKKILNLFKNPKVKMVIILTFLLFLYTSVCAISYAENVLTNISDSVFRLHVIANSDNTEDQNLKLLVRDDLLKYMNKLCSNCTTRNEAIVIVENNKETFKQIASDTIKKEGFDYSVEIEIGNFEFPTKNYGDISLPSGYYDGLKIKIGEAKGQNWWCVMFPPLCFVDISSGIVPEDSKEYMKENMNEEEFALVSDKNSSDIQFKFKLLEFLTDTGFITAKK